MINVLSRAMRRPPGEARRGGLDVFRRGATKPGGMDRRPNQYSYL